MWSPTAWSCSATAGTWSATTSPATTGAASVSTGSPRHAAAAAAFVRAGLNNVFATYDVEVLVEAPAAAIRQRIGRWCTVEDVDATRCRVRMTGDSLDWPVMALGMAAADFQVISPPELLGRVQDWARRFGRASLTEQA